ncbi:hypothetical protein [Glaciecola petra]|uniref:Phage shock protein B n=1 Tax=Glaciecola petra TaxID=3075602 RepID=A0ABU2ZM65_9ALTE|nr:hypothetical protein [Aestuariibacter sp. P117]MDT0593714.1 hypothetical protein [Aestuariibacter sp. P117]
MDITAIAIVGIIGATVVSLTKHFSANRVPKAANDQMTIEYEKMQKDLLTMSKRLEVLEKIVTDEKYNLNKEFEALKD